NRAGAALLAFAPEDVAEAGLSLTLSPCIHTIAERAAASCLRRDGPDLDRRITGDRVCEDLEAGPCKMLGHCLHLDRVAEVRLVRTVFPHCLRIGNPRKYLRDGPTL